MNFTDAVTVAGTRRTEDGYLVAEARAVRTGIQLYAGDEVGKPDMAVVKVYRPADSVFSDASLQSFTHAPITNDHPAEQVTADNWKALAIGEVSTAAKKDGEWVMLPLILKDAAAIKSVEDGKRELSAGYVCELDWTAGALSDGSTYDAIQKDIKINHLALVNRARAGSKARIGDGATSWGVSPVFNTDERNPDMPELRKMLVDGLQVETTDAGAAAIEKLQKDKDGLTSRLVAADAAHQVAIAAKDEEIGTLKADLKKAKDAIPTPDALSKLVADRAALEATVKAIAKDVKTEGVSDAEIRKAAVVAKLGDEMVKDASDAEIAGMFKAIAKDTASSDPIRSALLDRDNTHTVTNDNGQSAYEKRLADGWKTPAKGA